MLLGHSLADADGVILAIDETVTDALHRTRASVIGASYLGMTHPADRAQNIGKLTALRCDTGTVSIRKRYLREDGGSIWASVQVSRLGGGGHLVGAFEFDAPAPNQPYECWKAASQLLRRDERRRELFGAELADNHGWTILLQLYLAEAEGRAIDVNVMGRLTGLSHALIKRWLRVLEVNGLVEETVRPGPERQLSPTGIDRLERLIGERAA